MSIKNTLVVSILVFGITIAGWYALYDYYDHQVESRPVEAVVTYSDTWEGEEQTHLDLEYRYTVDGTTYTSTNVCPSTFTGGTCFGSPESVADRHPEGKTVTAYVDPDDPSRAYLLKGNTPYGIVLLAGGGTLFSLFILYELFSNRDQPDWKTR